MSRLRRNRQLHVLGSLDRGLTRWFNRSLVLTGVQPFFAFVSWLGNGKFWYCLMLLLPVQAGLPGLKAAAHLLCVGGVNFAVYRLIKSHTQRPRPCCACEDILRGAAPLDEFSFPSGHTMHSVAFTLTASLWFPPLFAPLAAFTILVALSRVILGLHYPTDVLLGALVGAMAAQLSILLL